MYIVTLVKHYILSDLFACYLSISLTCNQFSAIQKMHGAIGLGHLRICSHSFRIGKQLLVFHSVYNVCNNKITELRTILQRESQNS
jgi:hypothetical protein